MKRLLPVLLALSGTNAFAYSQYNTTRASDDDHLLSVGAGISSPSITSAISENPAGLTENRSFTFLGDVGSGNNQFNPLGYGGGLFMGNGSVGGGLSLQNFNSFEDGINGSSTLLDFGLAAEITQLNLSWGVSGSYLVASSGIVEGPGANTNFGINTGIIYSARPDFRVGATLFGLNDGIDAVAAGISYDPSPSATLTVDGSYDPGSQTAVLKPGAAIHLSKFQMAVGYGFHVLNSGFGWINTGGSLAVGFQINRTLAVQAYYNQLALYYAGLTVSL